MITITLPEWFLWLIVIWATLDIISIGQKWYIRWLKYKLNKAIEARFK